jgi:hypothetical protein
MQTDSQQHRLLLMELLQRLQFLLITLLLQVAEAVASLQVVVERVVAYAVP